MTGPSLLELVRNRAGLSWLILIAATLIAFVVGAEHSAGSASVVVVLGIAFLKVRLVGLDFMELRHGPMALRVLFEAYCVVLWVVLSALSMWL